MKSRTSFNFYIWLFSLLKETGSCWSCMDTSPILEPLISAECIISSHTRSEVRNYSLSPPIVIAGTTDAAGSQSMPDGLFISTSQLRSSSHQPEKQVQAETRADTRRLSPSHIVSQLTTGLTFGTLKCIPYLWRSNRTYQINSTLCQKYHTRWMLQHANNKENKF